MPGPKPLVSAIVIAQNQRERTLACLQALKSTADVPLEAILVDRSSGDGSVEAVRGRFPIVKIVRRPADSSYGVAGNAGLALAEGRFVLLLDSSVTVLPGCIGKLTDFLLTRPDMGATCPLLVNENGRLDPDARRAFPTPGRSVGAASGLNRIFPNSRFGGGRDSGGGRAHEIDAGSSSCLLVRRAAVDRVGFLDSDYGHEGAGLDLSYRLKAGGWKVYFVPEARALRTPLSLPKAEARKQVWARHRSLWTFHHKHYAANLSAFPNGLVWLANWARWLFETARIELEGQAPLANRPGTGAQGWPPPEQVPPPAEPPPAAAWAEPFQGSPADASRPPTQQPAPTPQPVPAPHPVPASQPAPAPPSEPSAAEPRAAGPGGNQRPPRPVARARSRGRAEDPPAADASRPPTPPPSVPTAAEPRAAGPVANGGPPGLPATPVEPAIEQRNEVVRTPSGGSPPPPERSARDRPVVSR